MPQQKKNFFCKYDDSNKENKNEHKEYLNLPCDHDTCRECFFDDIKKGSVKCESCDFVTDELDEYAKVGNRSACYIMGHMHHIGVGRDKDAKLAEKYYEKAAIFLGNDCYIYADLGNLYYTELNDEVKALEWYEKLFNAINLEKTIGLSDNESNFIIYTYELQNLAKLYIYGCSKGENYPLTTEMGAKKALDILSDLHKVCPSKDICWYIGEIHHRGVNGVMENLMEAYKWYELADCKYSMAIIQHDTKNYRMAIELLKLVPKEDEFYFEACKKLGNIYKESSDYNIKKDYVEAKNWYQNSLTDSDCTGYLEIGKLYEDGGYGITKDYIEAGIYYKLFLDKNKNPKKIRNGYECLRSLYKKISDTTNESYYRQKYDQLPYFRNMDVRKSKKRKYVNDTIVQNK